MALPVIPIAPETVAQANPVATSMGLMGDAISRNISNQYLPATLAAALMHAQIQNAIQAPQIQYAPQMAQTALQQAQANVPFTQAQTQELLSGRIPEAQALASLYGANANVANQTMPYKIQGAQEELFKDPILSRLYQAALANRTGAIPQSSMNMVGMGNTQNIPTAQIPGMPNFNKFLPTSSQPGLNQISPVNGSYSVNPATAPKAFGGDSAQNWALFGSPLNPIQFGAMKSGSEQQAKTGVDQWNDAMSSANKDADLGNALMYSAQQFQQGYKNSHYKGPLLGTFHSTGWKTPFLTGITGNLSSEQQADNASQNMAGLVGKLVAGGRVTNYELQFVKNMKPSREMTPETAQMASDFLIQRSQQMQELPKFLGAAQNMGLDVRTAQNLWNMYRQQRPIYDFQNNEAHPEYQGQWRDFLNQHAISAVQGGHPYVSIPNEIKDNKVAFNNWYNALTKVDQGVVRNELGGKLP